LLFILLEDIGHGEGTWVIVERLSDPTQQTFAQVRRVNSDSWVVEHRTGSADTHSGTTVRGLRQAHARLTGWAFDLDGWQQGATWS